jgi:hypothetical protein
MKVIREHDYLPEARHAVGPNLRALRGILAGLIAAAVISFGVIVFLIATTPPRQSFVHPLKKCSCPKACACHPGK